MIMQRSWEHDFDFEISAYLKETLINYGHSKKS